MLLVVVYRIFVDIHDREYAIILRFNNSLRDLLTVHCRHVKVRFRVVEAIYFYSLLRILTQAPLLADFQMLFV